MQFLEYQAYRLNQLAHSPLLFVVVLLALVLPLAVLVFNKSKWPVLTLMLYVSSLGRDHNNPGVRLVPVLDQLEGVSRLLITFLLFVLLLPTIWTNTASGWRSRLWLGGTTMFFVFEVALSVRDVISGNMDRGSFGLASFILMGVVMIVGVSRWLQSMEDVTAAIKSLCAVSVLLVIGTLAQIASGGGYILAKRLTATAENSNFAGLAIVSGLPATLYVLVRKDMPKVWKVAAAGTTGLLIVMLVWAGSRNAALMSAIVVFFMFGRRLGSFALFAVVVGGFAALGFSLYGGQIEIVGRLLSTTNTRAASWNGMIHSFLTNPIIGVGQMGYGSESSYLLSAARAGILAFLPMAISMALIGRALFQLWSVRPLLGEDQPVADMAMGGIVAILTGAMFDGYLTANFSVILLALFVYLAIAAFILDAVAVFGPGGVPAHDDVAPARADLVPVGVDGG